MTGNLLASADSAVRVEGAADENDVMPQALDVRVAGNRVVAGTPPENDPALGIVVRANVSE